MRKSLFFITLMVFFLFQICGGEKNKKNLGLFQSLQDLIISISDEIKPSVVHIEVVQKSGSIKYKSLASGLIIDERGYILTNEHVVDKAQAITVTLQSKLEYPAELVGKDKQTDLALIKIKTTEKLYVAKMGDSDKAKVGEWVIAVGNPYGFDRTVSFGIVSGKGRVFPNLPLETQLINDFIQTDAAIDPGSSGGPLVDLEGKVIGINSIGFGRGQGFTIPINTAKEVVKKLLSTGTIERGWMGVSIQPLNRDFAKYFGDPNLEGVLISDVEQNSPAKESGISPGDVIISYNQTKILAEKEEDLNKFIFLVSQSRIGEESLIKVVRQMDTLDIKVRIATQPKVVADEFETKLGFTVKEITEDIYKQNMLEDKSGVIVSYVEVGGVASQAELQDDDVVSRVEQTKISNLEDFKNALEQNKDKPRMLLEVKRGKTKRLILLLTETKKEEKTKE
jgi:serine protease Do